MLPWRRSHLSSLITSRFSPACTGSIALAALPVRDNADVTPLQNVGGEFISDPIRNSVVQSEL